METVYVSNSGYEFIILSKEGRNCIVQFKETGTVRSANIDNIRAGKVRDPYAVATYGVGYDGEFSKTPYWKQAKQLWRNMMKRCYCEKDTRGYFGRAVVTARWHCFANFLDDIAKLQNFNLWLEGQNSGKDKYNLDKDTLVAGCKVYSPSTCIFITEYENKAAGARNGKPYTKKARVGAV